MSLRKRLSSRWVTVLLVIVVGWLATEAVGIWLRVRTVYSEAERMEDRIAELERDIERRRVRLERSRHEDWLAYQARLRLNYKMPDEEVVVVYKKENSDIIGAVASASGQDESPGWLFRIWDTIRGMFTGLLAEAS